MMITITRSRPGELPRFRALFAATWRLPRFKISVSTFHEQGVLV